MWIISSFLWLVFFIACVLLTIIVLLQESKGGGLAEAFGGTGAETFGVKTRGVHRATLLLVCTVLVSAILIHGLRG